MTRGAPPAVTLDHLVVAAATLADGIEYFAQVAGVTAQPGGKHVAMGTHNALVRLSARTFSDIAIDPTDEGPRDAMVRSRQHALQAELRSAAPYQLGRAPTKSRASPRLAR